MKIGSAKKKKIIMHHFWVEARCTLKMLFLIPPPPTHTHILHKLKPGNNSVPHIFRNKYDLTQNQHIPQLFLKVAYVVEDISLQMQSDSPQEFRF